MTTSTRRRWRMVLTAGMLVLSGCASATGSPSVATSPSAGAPSSTTTPSATSAADFPLDITDANGKQHTFEGPVTRVGCNTYLCLGVLADLGIVPTAVSSGDEGDFMSFYYPHGTPAQM